MGFVFDTAPVSTEYTAIANVLSQYLPGLFCGNVEPETEIPKLNKALESAGLGNVIAEKTETVGCMAGSSVTLKGRERI